MDIKSYINEILVKENYTFTQLAGYLQKSEDQLNSELNNKTLELRNLEAIAKALRVPLYSFFGAEMPTLDLNHHPSQMNKLWTGIDSMKDVKQLQAEIELFKQIIALKEAQIKLHSS